MEMKEVMKPNIVIICSRVSGIMSPRVLSAVVNDNKSLNALRYCNKHQLTEAWLHENLSSKAGGVAGLVGGGFA